MERVRRIFFVRAQRSHLKKPRFFKKANCVFFLFSDIERKVFVVSSEKHGHGCQNWVFTLHRSNLRTKYWKFFCVLSDLSRKLSQFQPKRWNKSVGIGLFLSTRIIWEKLEFLKKNKLSLFSQFEPKFFGFLKLKHRQVCRICFRYFQKNILRKKILNNFYISYRVLSENFPDFWMKNLWRAVGTTLIVLARLIWRKQFCLGKKIFFIFRILH